MNQSLVKFIWICLISQLIPIYSNQSASSANKQSPNSSPTITKQKHIIPANRHQQQWTISEVHSLQWIIKYSEYLLHGLQKRDSKGCWERDWLEKGLLRDEEGLEM